jgi:hypothetical protein
MIGLKDQMLPELLTKLNNHELEYDKLKKTTAENNPVLTSIREQINKIRPGILENIENQRANLQASKLTCIRLATAFLRCSNRYRKRKESW